MSKMHLSANASSVLRRLNQVVVMLVTLQNFFPIIVAENGMICPGTCWCDTVNEKSVAVCWNHNLASIPQHFDKRLQEIALMFNNITVIQDYVFHGLSNVSILLMQQNQVKEVHEQAFDGLYNLIYLDLSHNKITKIPSRTIQNNEKLKFLYLQHNEISIVGPFLISESLSILDLSFNRIYFLPHDAFIGTPNLIKLKINNNYITELEMYAFRGLRKLQTLSSGNNVINNLDYILFFGLDEIKYVDFSNNSISDLTPRLFENNIHLRYLFLKNNSFSINSGPILISESLSHLDISYCNITSLPTDAFIYLANLTSLRMVGNPFSKLDVETMLPLKKLQVVLLGSETSCSDLSFQSVFQYFQQKSITYYASPLCSTESNPVTLPTTIVSSSQIPQTILTNATVYSTNPSSTNTSSQTKVIIYRIHEQLVLIIGISCVLKVCR